MPTNNKKLTITHVGVEKDMPSQTKRSIIITNYICLILIGATVILEIYASIKYNSLPNWGVALMNGFIFLAPLLFNYFKWTNISRIIVCYFPVMLTMYNIINVMQLAETVQITHLDGLRIYLLCLGIIPYLVADFGRPILLAFGALPAIICLLFLNDIITIFNVDLSNLSDDAELMGIRTFIAYMVISLGCLTLQIIISKYDKANERLIAQLEDKSEEIEAQNEKLMANQNKLYDLNHNLELLVEERSSALQKQADVLLRYAFTNAHEVRGPIARVMGLIELSKMDTEINQVWLLQKIQVEIDDVDKIIRDLSYELEKAHVFNKEVNIQ